MCGILGGWSKDKGFFSDTTIVTALKSISHRGPDDYGYERIDLTVDGEVLLGHTRLSIIDLSSAGHQPMHTVDGEFSLVFNGEIYNYKEIRKELELAGHRFITSTDTEVLLVSWSVWGPECLKKLIGMFSFVIYNKAKNSLTCVRDGFGIKPFFYRHEKTSFCFGSEIKPVVTLSSVKAKIDWQRSYDYLVQSDYDSDSRTFVDGVKHLMPGHYMELDLHTGALTDPYKWWTPSLRQRSDISFADAADLVREEFLSSIKLHLRSDVPLGATLSGGLDSSAVVCAMRYVEPDAPIHTFSYVAAGSHLSEQAWAEKVNKHVNTKGNFVSASSKDLIKDIDKLISCQGEPFGSTSLYAQFRVFELAKNCGITVTLDGQGADELLAGYNGYPMQRMRSLLENREFADTVRFTKNWSKWPGRSMKTALMNLGASMLPDNLLNIASALFVRTPTPDWIDMDVLRDAGVVPKSLYTPLDGCHRGRRVVEQLSKSLQVRGLPQLLRHGDRNSMHFSIESRVPFLTNNLAELLLSVPEDYLISNNGETKHVFRAAMRGIVPDEILDRKDKIGFETPEHVWLLEMAPTFRQWLVESEDIPFIKTDELLKSFDAVISGKQPFTWQVWRWINFVRWYRLF